MHRHLTKRSALEQHARLEIMLAKVKDEFDSATFHKNVLVADCLKNADATMRTAADHLFDNQIENFVRASNVAWLLICFAKQVLDSDSIEHLLGENDYVELNENLVSPSVRATMAVADLEKLVFKLRAEIRDKKAGAET